MLKKVFAGLATLLAAASLAAVEANTASQADLEAIDGVGPTLSANLIDERKKGPFRDWNDLRSRVRGVGERSAARLSARGMTVDGKPYGGAPHAEPVKTPGPQEAGPPAGASGARK
jgi:competence protein ComEA